MAEIIHIPETRKNRHYWKHIHRTFMFPVWNPLNYNPNVEEKKQKHFQSIVYTLEALNLNWNFPEIILECRKQKTQINFYVWIKIHKDIGGFLITTMRQHHQFINCMIKMFWLALQSPSKAASKCVKTFLRLYSAPW